jgi:hypothetical protein
VAVDQLQSAVGEFVGQQAAGEADFLVNGFEGDFLGVGVGAKRTFESTVWFKRLKQAIQTNV